QRRCCQPFAWFLNLHEVSGWQDQRPLNCGARFCRNADVPSVLSSVAAHRPKYEASRARPSLWLVSNPLLFASSAYLTAIGAFEAIRLRMASARVIRSAAGTISLMRPIR